jgi:hypothetical protein
LPIRPSRFYAADDYFMFFRRFFFHLIAPWKVTIRLRGIPVIMALLSTILIERFVSFLSSNLLFFVNEMIAKKEIPDWAAGNIQILSVLLPFLASIPVLIACAASPMRLAVISNNEVPFMHNIKSFWHALTKSTQSYGYSWKILPWYLIPFLALLMTLRLAPYFIPTQFEIVFQIFIVVFGIISLLRALPVILVPLTATLGMYESYHSLLVTRDVVRFEKYNILLALTLWGCLSVAISKIAFITADRTSAFSIELLIAIFFLAVLSSIFIQPMAVIEQRQMR